MSKSKFKLPRILSRLKKHVKLQCSKLNNKNSSKSLLSMSARNGLIKLKETRLILMYVLVSFKTTKWHLLDHWLISNKLKINQFRSEILIRII